MAGSVVALCHSQHITINCSGLCRLISCPWSVCRIWPLPQWRAMQQSTENAGDDPTCSIGGCLGAMAGKLESPGFLVQTDAMFATLRAASMACCVLFHAPLVLLLRLKEELKAVEVSTLVASNTWGPSNLLYQAHTSQFCRHG